MSQSTARVMVRYQLKAERVEENEAAVREVFSQLEREQTPGLRYATFKLEDGVSFMHIAYIETADGRNPLLALESFQRFTAAIRERCEEPPSAVKIEQIGAYRSWDAG